MADQGDNIVNDLTRGGLVTGCLVASQGGVYAHGAMLHDQGLAAGIKNGTAAVDLRQVVVWNGKKQGNEAALMAQMLLGEAEAGEGGGANLCGDFCVAVAQGPGPR